MAVIPHYDDMNHPPIYDILLLLARGKDPAKGRLLVIPAGRLLVEGDSSGDDPSCRDQPKRRYDISQFPSRGKEPRQVDVYR